MQHLPRWVLSLTLIVLMLAVAARFRFRVTTLTYKHTITTTATQLPDGFDWSRAFKTETTSTSSSSSSIPGPHTTHRTPISTRTQPPHTTTTPTLPGLRNLESPGRGQSRHLATMAPVETPDAEAAKTPSSDTAASAEPELPKLSAADFRVYNRLAVMMDAYHNHFRYSWNILYKACTAGSRPAGMSIRSFVAQGLHLSHALTMHHTIEEQHVFPELAERMPAFAPHDHLISQHEQIHVGLEKLEAYLNACQSGERELRLSELKDIMDSFGQVLWDHLDDEVRMLGAENIRKYWSKDEVLSMNW